MTPTAEDHIVVVYAQGRLHRRAYVARHEWHRVQRVTQTPVTYDAVNITGYTLVFSSRMLTR